MPVYCHNNTRILFCHIPKTAGSSITTAFRNAGYTVKYINEPAKTGTPDHKPCNPQHWHQELINTRIRTENHIDFEFAVTRHPLHRLISEFTWRLPGAAQHANSQGYDSVFWHNFQGWALHQFENYKHDPYTADNHIRPQTHFISARTHTYDITQLDTLAKHLQPFGVQNIPVENTSTKKTKPNTVPNPVKAFVRAYSALYGQDHEELGYEQPF